MKQIKFLAISACVFLLTGFNKASDSTTPNRALQCGVSNAQIADYLRNCSHHHTVNWVQDIPGTCNSLASIEACSTAVVYVVDGNITGHLDSNGYCD